MKTRVLSGFCLLTVGLCFLQVAPAPAQDAARRPRTSAEQSLARADLAQPQTVEQVVRAIVEPWKQEQRAPGVIVVVRQHYRTDFFPFGTADHARRRPVTPETIFELASVTKVFTTTSLAMEVQAGRMRLDDSVAEYIPLLRNRGGDIRRVTLEQLATHTSSLPRIPNGRRADGQWNRKLVLEWAAGWRAAHPPGTQGLYSNVAMGLLGYAIADREERPLIEVWREQFLNPLKMHHTFFEIPPAAAPLMAQGFNAQGRPVEHSPLGGWPAGGRLSSSGRNMAEFLVANMGERADLPEITQAMKLAQRPYFKVSEKMMQGLAWQRIHLEGKLLIDKDGALAGTSTFIGFLPEQHIGVVVMTNRGKCSATGVGRKLLAALAANEHQSGEAAEAD